MKVIVQISCLNEEQTLPAVLKSIPKKIQGIDSVEVLIIDDGCTDDTVAVAKKLGVKHFVHHAQNRGLASGFRDGLNRSLELGADIIVHTDGDNQYPQSRIPDLVKPVLEGKADIVIADRQVAGIKHFSPTKKLFQKIGTRVLNTAAGTKVADAPSGFRAYSREAAMKINVVTRFSYTMETIIQAGNKQLAIVSVPVVTNPKTRESRLFKNPWEHIRKSGMAIVRAYLMYKPAEVFVTAGCTLLVIGLIPFLRYFYFYWFNESHGAHHLQSLILGSVILIASFISFALAAIADLIRINRALIEENLYQTKLGRYGRD